MLAVGAFDPELKRRHDIDLWLRVIRDHSWSYDTLKSVAYRVDTPGSISQDIPTCEYYYLCALLKNQAAYHGPLMDHLIGIAARRAMSLSFVDGAPTLYAQAREIAWSRIPLSYRLSYRCASVCPPLFRSVIRAKRRLFWFLHPNLNGSGAS